MRTAITSLLLTTSTLADTNAGAGLKPGLNEKAISDLKDFCTAHDLYIYRLAYFIIYHIYYI